MAEQPRDWSKQKFYKLYKCCVPSKKKKKKKKKKKEEKEKKNKERVWGQTRFVHKFRLLAPYT